MTEEEARNELKQYRYDKAIERSRIETLEEMRTDCMKMTSILNDMPQPATRNVHKIEEKYIRYLDLQNEVLEMLNRTMIKTIKITKKIEKLKQPYRGIIEAKYVIGLRTWEIANKFNISIRTLNRLTNEAIKMYKIL